MKYLFDTHVLIWFAEDNRRLSKEFKDIIADTGNDLYVSAATIWEIIIKQASKKIKLKFSIDEMVRIYKFPVLDIKMDHVLKVAQLPNIHKDPFDRILIAQTKVEGLILLTADKVIVKYFSS